MHYDFDTQIRPPMIKVYDHLVDGFYVWYPNSLFLIGVGPGKLVVSGR